jgi:hypothetical protein
MPFPHIVFAPKGSRLSSQERFPLLLCVVPVGESPGRVRAYTYLISRQIRVGAYKHTPYGYGAFRSRNHVPFAFQPLRGKRQGGRRLKSSSKVVAVPAEYTAGPLAHAE